MLFPSVVTVFAICAGLTSVKMSMEGHIEAGLYFILLAVFLDAADGKLARFLDTASPFGAELDTLADFFNFGIAPGIMIYHTLYQGTEYANLGWLATLVLAICCALRLARFNLSSKGEEVSLKKDSFFVGVPAPALGMFGPYARFYAPVWLGKYRTSCVARCIYYRCRSFSRQYNSNFFDKTCIN